MSLEANHSHEPAIYDPLLQGILRANQALLAAPPLNAALSAALAVIGKASRADRIYLYQHHRFLKAGATMGLHQEWVDDGIVAQHQQPLWQIVDYEQQGLQRWRETLAAGGAITGLVSTLPVGEQAFFKDRQTLALFLIPIFVRHQLWGCLGFDLCHGDTPWSETECTLLQLFAQGVSSAILQQKTVDHLQVCQAQVQKLSSNPQIPPPTLLHPQAILHAQQDAIPAGILVLNEHRHIVSYNPQFCRLWSVSHTFLEQEDSDALLEHMAQQLETAADFLEQIEQFYRAPQGKRQTTYTLKSGISLQQTSTPAIASTGEVIGHVWCFHDITAHRQVERQIEESYTLLRGVINSTEDFIFVKDSQGKYRLVNEAMAKAFNTCQENLLGKSDIELFTPEIAQVMQQFDRQLLHTGQPQVFEQRLPIDDESRTFLASKTLYRDANGDVLGLVGINRDITEIQQVKAERNRFFRLSSDMMCTVGLDGYLQEVNPSFTRLLGYSREELLSQPLAAFIHGADRGGFEQVLDRVKEGEPFQSFENRCRCKNGDCRWFSWSVTPDQENQIFYATARDITERHRTEKALQASERRFRDVMAAAGEYVWEITATGVYTFLTQKVHAIKGIPAADLLGRSLFSLMPPEDAAAIQKGLEDTAQQKQSFRFEHRSITPQGQIVWEEMSGLPVLDPAGNLMGFRGTSLDITEKKQSEASLNLFKQAVESSSDGVCLTDSDFQYIYHNAAFAKLFEVQDAAPLAAEFINRDRAYVDTTIAPTIAEAILQRQSYAGEVLMRSHKGKIIPMLLRAHAICDEDSNIIGIVRAYTDISDRKAAEAQLKIQEEFLRSIYDGTAHRIFALTHSHNKIVYSGHNRAAEEATGWSSDSVVGLTPVELFGETEGRTIEAICQRCIHSKSAITQEEHITLGGKKAWVMTTFNPLQDYTGQVHRIVGTSFDITPIKAAEAELKQQTEALQSTLQELQQTQSHLVQSEKMSSLGQLVAGVAHEINNPVNFIYGNLTHARHYTADLLKLVEFYRTYYPTPHPHIQEIEAEIDLDFLVADLPKLLSSMKVGAERIQGIVSSLRIFSHMDEADMKAVNIHDGIDSTLMILQNRLKAKSDMPEIQIVRDYGALPLVECWAGQLNQVFMNILSNAIDALEETKATIAADQLDPLIRITTRLTQEHQATIAIQDNGPGISDVIRDRLFDPFFTTKPIGKGTGMGLAISYQIVTEKHHGRLRCLSQVGNGTTFVITIPTHQPE